jgi:hypothetical protein
MMRGRGLNWSSLGLGLAEGSCKHGRELPGYMNGETSLSS